jgi:hypothetical protein
MEQAGPLGTHGVSLEPCIHGLEPHAHRGLLRLSLKTFFSKDCTVCTQAAVCLLLNIWRENI